MSQLQSDEVNLAASVCVVLSRTTHPGNIGAVARAMKNMGLNQLRLANPSPAEELDASGTSCVLPAQQSHEAVRRSSGAHDLLEICQVYESLEDALGDIEVVIGASARTRKMPWPLLDPKQTADIVINSLSSSDNSRTRVALLFGNEASGLSNEELQRCHYHVNIPAVESFASLNLAMAVQLVCYEVRMALLSARTESLGSESGSLDIGKSAPTLVSQNDSEEELATVNDLDGFLSHLEETLVKIGFLDPDNPRLLMPKLRRLYSRARLEKVEINILRGILKATQKKT